MNPEFCSRNGNRSVADLRQFTTAIDLHIHDYRTTCNADLFELDYATRS